ncbi:hypothetical protein LINPERPRIM_LOCUS20681 [Linum perenne]
MSRLSKEHEKYLSQFRFSSLLPCYSLSKHTSSNPLFLVLEQREYCVYL